MWTQLAAPDLRVQFPIAGPVRNNTIYAPSGKVTAAPVIAHRIVTKQPGALSPLRHVPPPLPVGR
jgi:hypothetical protein